MDTWCCVIHMPFVLSYVSRILCIYNKYIIFYYILYCIGMNDNFIIHSI